MKITKSCISKGIVHNCYYWGAIILLALIFFDGKVWGEERPPDDPPPIVVADSNTIKCEEGKVPFPDPRNSKLRCAPEERVREIKRALPLIALIIKGGG